MAAELTARLQARIIPKLTRLLDQAGQTVTIRRPGLPDTQHRAVLYQEDNQGVGGVADPTYKTLGWQGIFTPDAPLRERGYTIIDQHGREFVPDGDSQDIVEQGVAWIVHLLPLAERTRVEQLTFQLPGVGTIRDGKGNLVPAPGPLLHVAARLTPTTDPRIRDMAGADEASTVLVGRWGTLQAPQLKPDGVGWGSRSPLILDGQSGTLTLKVAYPDPDLAQEQVYGARFVATWKAG